MRVIIALMAIAIILLTIDVIGEKPLTRPQPPVATAPVAGLTIHKKADRPPLRKPHVRKPAPGQVIILPPLR
jgi:hypothetical protein